MRPNAVPVLHWLVGNEIGYDPRTVPVQSPLRSPSSPRLALAGKSKNAAFGFFVTGLRAQQGGCSWGLVAFLSPRLSDSAAFLLALLSSNACTLLVCNLDLFVARLRVMWQPTLVVIRFDQTKRPEALVDFLLPFILRESVS